MEIVSSKESDQIFLYNIIPEREIKLQIAYLT